MRIRRLRIRDLRRYRELDIDLAPGVTVVRGPNEAGKSTIQRAIELAITRRVTSSAADLEALRPWDAAAETRPWIALDFEQEEEDGRLATGTLSKTFAGQKGTVELTYDGQTVSDPTLADQVLAELHGHPDRALLPFHGVGPPSRAERPRARRDGASRPPAGEHQRRRPGHRPGQEEAREGAPRPDHEGREEPGPAQGRRGGRRLHRRLGRTGRARAQPARARSRLAVRRPRTPGPGRGQPGRTAQHAREGPPG